MTTWFTSPTPYRLNAANTLSAGIGGLKERRYTSAAMELPMLAMGNGHTSHPDFAHLVLLVFEAVLEVVCVSLPGYIVARRGMFDAEAQKMVANLNVQVFTPCLVFTKLASQLNADKLTDLAVIPVIFCVQTLVSWVCARLMSKAFGFGKRQTNFVIAMGVFGNSNSLPISLVISLSKTLKGLHWDRVPHDNDNEVAARGILYLLIFQQLGQLVRWTWGYNVLLAPAIEDTKVADEARDNLIEEGRYRDDIDEEDLEQASSSTKKISGSSGTESPRTVSSMGSSSSNDALVKPVGGEVMATPTNGNIVGTGPGNMAGNLGPHQHSADHMTQFPNYSTASTEHFEPATGIKASISQFFARIGASIKSFFNSIFAKLPPGMQKFLSTVSHYASRFIMGTWAFMNPPLWAMVAALIVASIPQLQHTFFAPHTFVSNSVTRAVQQSGGVAVPLILVVLGANLARNTLPQEELTTTPEGKKEERNLLIAALVSRMLLPTLIMAPFLAIFAKYVPVSILDDPIFVIVCFLLTGAPSALQLAQICQINGVFMGVMSKLLVQSYVVWILPSTLVLVMVALEVVEWAA
ncbi:auxin efflux carrier [Aureobasidium sp. EXF-8845]|nr:auxin efflux carrier [Aureobasidium sp. EXF-8845]KAI4855178.1 auxin efflux carrier [Aureobasidium sp. EXF-8846]